MITYEEESLDSCLEEIKPLLEDHYEQVAMYKDKISLNPDYSKYYALEGLDMLSCVVARDEDSKVVGYFISIISPNMHYKDHDYALNDVVYIEEKYRDKGLGLEMFTYAEDVLKKRGVSVIVIHMKTSLPFDSLCKGLDYDYAERNYTKYIRN